MVPNRPPVQIITRARGTNQKRTPFAADAPPFSSFVVPLASGMGDYYKKSYQEYVITKYVLVLAYGYMSSSMKSFALPMISG